MKLTPYQLSVMGFSGIKDRKDYMLGQTTVILGKNGANKSSIISAFSAATFGYVPKSALNVNSSDAVAEIEFRGIDPATGDVVSEKFKTVANEEKTSHYASALGEKKASAKKTVAEERKRITKMPPEKLELLTRGNQEVIDMAPEDMNDLFKGVITTTVDRENLISKLDLSPSQEEYFRTALPDKVGLEQLDLANKAFVEKRRTLKKDVEVADREAAFIMDGKSLVKGDITFLQGKREEILKKISESTTGEKAKFEYEQKLEAYNRHVQKITELSSTLIERPEPVDEASISALRERLEGIRKAISTQNESLRILHLNNDAHRKNLENLATNHCPLSDKLICTTDKTPIRDSLEALIEQNCYQIKSIESTMEIQRETEKNCIAEINRLEDMKRKCEAFLLKEAELEALRKTIPEKPVPITSIESKFEPIEVLKGELARIDDAIKTAVNAEKASALLETVKDKKEEVAILEKLVPVTAQKGDAYNVILNALTSGINTEMNKIAEDLGVDIHFEFVVDKGMNLMGKHPGDAKLISVKHMSTGERFIAQLLLLVLMNKIYDNQFIVMDNIDCLDDMNLNKVLKLVTSSAFRSRITGIILAGVNHADTGLTVDEYEKTTSDFKVINL